jgi:hypothetical protein
MMNNVNLEDLPFSAKARIVWGFLWRALMTTVGSSLCGGILGGIAGVIVGIFNFPKTSGAIAGGVIGAICGVYFLYLLIRWLLKSRIGNFKLVLMQVTDEI